MPASHKLLSCRAVLLAHYFFVSILPSHLPEVYTHILLQFSFAILAFNGSVLVDAVHSKGCRFQVVVYFVARYRVCSHPT